MSMVDIIEQRLLTTMTKVLETGQEPEPMLAFGRGETELGVISGPEMPREPEKRFEIYRAWASFMTMYGATEAVLCRDVVVSIVTDPEVDPASIEPNDDPAAKTALQVIRFPSTFLWNIWYHLGDHGEIVWEGRKEPGGTSEEIGVTFLSSAMGWAPVDQASRIAAPQWLKDRAPGATVGLMTIAVE